MTTSSAGLRPRRQANRLFQRDPWPQPSFTPQTVTGAGALDDFNAGATQLLTARLGWSPNGVQSPGEISWRTDATPTVADATLTPASAHSNVWNDRFNRDQEVWVTFGTPGLGLNDMVLLFTNLDANGVGGGNSFVCYWRPDTGLFTVQTGGTIIATTLGAPAAGDSFCLQREFPYLFGWYKRAAGPWTYVLSMVDATLASGWIGFQQGANGVSTITAFGGGSFYSRAPHVSTGPRPTWAGRS